MPLEPTVQAVRHQVLAAKWEWQVAPPPDVDVNCNGDIIATSRFDAACSQCCRIIPAGEQFAVTFCDYHGLGCASDRAHQFVSCCDCCEDFAELLACRSQ